MVSVIAFLEAWYFPQISEKAKSWDRYAIVRENALALGTVNANASAISGQSKCGV
jgi:hypothetical protein